MSPVNRDVGPSTRSVSRPPKLKKRGGPKPTVLFVDDDPRFLHLTEECWREFYPEDANIYTLNPEEKDPVLWIRDHLEKNQPLDAVFLDENIPGQNALHILEELQKVKVARYLPVVLMTAFPDNASDAEALEKGALRYIYKNTGDNVSGLFLHDALFAIAQFRDQVEDVMWIDFIRDVARRLADKQPVNKVVDAAFDFLSAHFGSSAIYVRKHEDERLHLLGSKDFFNAGTELLPETVPYLAKLLKPDGLPGLRRDALTVDDLGEGRWDKLKGWRLVAVPLVIGTNRIGTVTLYRHPERHPFRAKDEIFLRHFALEIAVCLGAEGEMHQLRSRQTQLAQFVQDISNAEDEKKASKLLTDFLHTEIQQSDESRAKTTVRLLETGKPTIPRLWRRGLQPNREDNVVDIYQENSVYARVVKNRQTEHYGNIPEETKDKGFVYTHSDVRSALTVPLISTGLCLGAVNLEHLNQNYYNSEDKELATAVANLTAYALVKLKAQRFIKGLLELVNDLVQPPPRSSPETLLSQAFALLHDFTGYARLLYLVPGDNPNAPWRVQRAIGDDATTLGEEEIKRWQVHISENWEQTFVRKTLFPNARTYTVDKKEMVSDEEVAIKTEAMEVVHLYRGSDRVPVGMLALLFLLPDAINPFQRVQLNMFGQFIGTLMEVGGNIRRILDEATLAEQEAVLGRALIMFQHRLRTELGIIGQALNNAEDEGKTGTWLDRARNVLIEITSDIKNTRFFAKVPEHGEFAIETVWNGVISRFSAQAQSKGIDLRECSFPEPIKWTSDPDIVGMILENLVQNAVEHCRPRDFIELQIVTFPDQLRLTVRDSGPGVLPSIVQKLFEPGITTKSDGSGSGLNLSRRRARDLQGDLIHEMENKPGASFSLILPNLSKT